MSNFISIKLGVVSLLLSIERHLRWNSYRSVSFRKIQIQMIKMHLRHARDEREKLVGDTFLDESQ